jgi:serine/threonine-protein kinase
MRTTDTPTGALLGDRYLLTRPLGAGASATVYLAEDQSLRRAVAVKVLRAGVTHDESFLRRFRAEAVAVAGLNHPHVLRVFDWGEADGDAWLVTEYLAGGSLRDLLDARGRLSPEQTVAIGTQAAEGLAYAHAQGFVHRDVKPANLLFDDTGRVRIADFGVARALAEAQWTEPAEGLIGTVRYTSPEQAQGRPVDGKADVYSLALVLYECVTGEVPFVADTQVATLHARIGARLPFHPALGDLEDVLRDAAEPDPADRLDAAELHERLAHLSRALPEPPPRAARPAAASVIGFRPPTAEQLTGPHRAVGRGASGTVPAVRRDADATEVGVPDATLVGTRFAEPEPEPRPAPAPVDGPPSTPTAAAAGRRRRWPWVLATVAVAAALAAGGLVASGAFTAPTYTVPLLVGLNTAQAQAKLAHGETLVVGYRASRTVAANTIMSQSPGPNTQVPANAVFHVVASGGPPPVTVPPVISKTCGQAIAALKHVGFAATCPPPLYAFSSSIPQGMAMGVYFGNVHSPVRAPYGAALAVQLSKGPPPLPVPNVVGLPGLEAVSTLRQSGFVPVVEPREFDRAVHAGNVISISPLPGAQLQPGRAVQVVISNGAPATVPSLGHADLATAEAIIVRAGLTVLAVHGATSSHSWTTVPPAGTVVTAGSSVTLYGH